MSRDPHVAVKFRALAQAMNAQNGEIDQVELQLLARDVADLLPEGSRLGAAVTEFLERCQLWKRDPIKMASAGRELQHYIEVHNMPEPANYERGDTHG